MQTISTGNQIKAIKNNVGKTKSLPCGDKEKLLRNETSHSIENESFYQSTSREDQQNQPKNPNGFKLYIHFLNILTHLTITN